MGLAFLSLLKKTSPPERYRFAFEKSLFFGAFARLSGSATGLTM